MGHENASSRKREVERVNWEKHVELTPHFLFSPWMNGLVISGHQKINVLVRLSAKR